ncbi:MAG TPA: FAD:protein FMN transferase, partial [Bdellovibrio sp.]|nr:FAD:protein FMN transferase [Bdellovibrio sp.]
MNKSKVASKRVRPLLGTFVEVSLFTEGDFNEAVSKTFELAQSLEQIFNLHDPNSEISQLNARVDDDTFEISASLAEVIERAEQITELSEGAFNPWREGSDYWDLNGIAKGYIVDKMVEYLLQQNSSLSGVINAGGDLRFFNSSEKSVTLRLGSFDEPVVREISLVKNAIATSSPSISVQDEKSSTTYSKSLREGLNSTHSVSVMANECMIADAL